MENIILKTFVYVGIPTIIAALIWIGRKLQILDDLKNTTDKIKHNVKVVCDTLIKTNSIDFDHEKLRSYSPLHLTDKGEEFIREVGFDKTFEDNKRDFYEFIKSENPRNPYDIELASIKSIFILFDKEYFSSVKNYLYNNPNEKKFQVASVLGVYVRDKYMADNK